MEAHGCIIYYTYVLASCVVLGTDLYLTLLANFSVIAHTLANRGFFTQISVLVGTVRLRYFSLQCTDTFSYTKSHHHRITFCAWDATQKVPISCEQMCTGGGVGQRSIITFSVSHYRRVLRKKTVNHHSFLPQKGFRRVVFCG